MQHLPIILIELVLVFGGVLAFGWWQLRSVKRDRLKAAERRATELTSQAEGGDDLLEQATQRREDLP